MVSQLIIYEYIIERIMIYSPMAGETIANFDSYVIVAVGLFIVGLFAVMVYERSSSKAKRDQQQQQHTGTAADTEK
jgi:hypothetical protein